MQHWQSSPHQQGSLTGGFEVGPLAIDGEVPEEVAEVVEGGISVVQSALWWYVDRAARLVGCLVCQCRAARRDGSGALTSCRMLI